jgi:hypothetical protein
MGARIPGQGRAPLNPQTALGSERLGQQVRMPLTET